MIRKKYEINSSGEPTYHYIWSGYGENIDTDMALGQRSGKFARQIVQSLYRAVEDFIRDNNIHGLLEENARLKESYALLTGITWNQANHYHFAERVHCPFCRADDVLAPYGMLKTTPNLKWARALVATPLSCGHTVRPGYEVIVRAEYPLDYVEEEPHVHD